MKGRFVTIVIFALLISAGIVFFQFWSPSKPYISPLKAIPLNTAVLIKANGVLPLLTQLSNNTIIQNSEDQQVKKFLETIKQQLDSLAHEFSFLNDLFNDSSLYIAITGNNIDNLGFVFSTWFSSNTKLEKLEEQLIPLFKTYHQSCIRYGSNDQSNSNNQWYYFLDNGLFVIGNNFKNVDESFRQIKRNVSLFDDTSFLKINNTIGKNVIANVFINISNIKKMSTNYFQESTIRDIENTFSSVGWVALDINIDNEFIGYQGFSVGKPSKSIWSKILKVEQPAENQIYSYLPENTVYFNSFTYSDPFNFSLISKDKLKRDRRFSEQIKALRDDFNFEIDLKVAEIMGDAVLMLLTKNETGEYFKYCIIKTTDPVEAMDLVKKMANKPDREKDKNGSKNDKEKNEAEDVENEHNDIEYSFVKLPSGTLPVLLFGSGFEGYSYEYACNYKECIIIGSSEEGLHQLVSQISDKQLLVNDSAFRKTCMNLFSSRNNVTGYINLKNTWEHIVENIKPEIAEKIKDIFISSSGQPLIGYQFSGNGELTYNNGFIYSKAQEPTNTRLRWTLDFDTTISKLYELDYKTSRHKAIFVQDKSNIIYYVTLKGSIKWQREIDGEILGQPYTIKYFKDKGQCLVFNTENSIYIIDNEGNDVDDYPITFKNKASNGLTVADFDNNQNYRFYIAFENKSFVALTKTGSKVDGWQFDKTADVAQLPALCYSYDRKDYVFLSSGSKFYILNRKGGQRIDVSDKYDLGNILSFSVDARTRYFRVITIDSEQNIKAIYPDGHIEKIEIDKGQNPAFISIADIDGNNENDYIICDSTNLFAVNSKNEKLFSLTLPVEVSNYPLVVKNYKDERFAIVENSDSKNLFIVSNSGDISKDSPLNGNFPIIFISLTDISQSSGLVCSDSNQLLYYIIK